MTDSGNKTRSSRNSGGTRSPRSHALTGSKRDEPLDVFELAQRWARAEHRRAVTSRSAVR